MAVKVEWYLPGRILRVSGALTFDDFLERDRQVLARLDTEGKRPMVHVLLDHSGLSEAERTICRAGFQAYSQAGFAREYPDHPRVSRHYLLGWTVNIALPSLKYLVDGLARIGQFKWHSCDTLKEALAFLKSVDHTLPDDLA